MRQTRLLPLKPCGRRPYRIFIETGTNFIKDGKLYRMPDKRVQSEMAYKSGVNFQGKPMRFDLRDTWGQPIPEAELYRPHFRRLCQTCGSKLICNGCSDCGNCEKDRR